MNKFCLLVCLCVAISVAEAIKTPVTGRIVNRPDKAQPVPTYASSKSAKPVVSSRSKEALRFQEKSR